MAKTHMIDPDSTEDKSPKRSGVLLLRDKMQRTLRKLSSKYHGSRKWAMQAERKLKVRALVWLLKARYLIERARRWCQTAITYVLGTLFSVVACAAFALTVPQTILQNSASSLSDVHLACAAIVGTALALVLSLSIIPAQKAADVFSSAVVQLYARDRITLLTFGVLVAITVVSVLLGTNWNVGLNPKLELAGQIVALGLSFDALFFFYRRNLELLIPRTALGLVMKDCIASMDRVARDVERLVQIDLIARGDDGNATLSRAGFFVHSQIDQRLNAWVEQLTEFAHKGISRRDTEAVNEVISTVVAIGIRYARVRKTSLVMLPDMIAPLSEGQTDVSKVLDPIYEAIKFISLDAATQRNEQVVRRCIRGLGQLAASAMEMIPDHPLRRSAPLAYAPMFYIDVCVQQAIEAKMEDALLTAVSSIGAVLDRIDQEVDTHPVEDAACDCLIRIASAGYSLSGSVSVFRAVEMMMLGALKDVKVHGYEPPTILSKVLALIGPLMPLEVAMELAGKRTMQVLAPYTISSGPNLVAVLNAIALQIEDAAPDRRRVDPFNDFAEASEDIASHFRQIAENVNFRGTLLQKWVIDSVVRSIKVHIQLLCAPPKGGEEFLDTIANRILSLVWIVPLFFRSKEAFQKHRADEACDGLAALGLLLMKSPRVEIAVPCGQAISRIATQSADLGLVEPYALADLYTSIRILVRGAETLKLSAHAALFEKLITTPKIVEEKNWPHYSRALETRFDQLEDRIERFDSIMHLRDDAASILYELLEEYEDDESSEDILG